MSPANDIPDQMQAVQVVEYKQPYQINTVPVPRPESLAPHELLVKVAVASYCHTDSMVRNGVFGTALPCTASHEGSGTVVASGPAAAAGHIGVGDRVMVGLPRSPCGECDDCAGPEESWRQYCTHLTRGHVGVHIDGCMAQYVVADARHTTPLPAAVSMLDAAPLACAGRTVWRGVEQAGLRAGETLAIVGSGGGLGHLGIAFAKKKGLRVVGIDARDEGLAVSHECGADLVVDARKGKEAAVKEVQEATDGRGADATLVLSEADTAAALGCAVTKMHGLLVQIAQPAEVKIPFQELIFRDIRVRGSVLASPAESQRMVDFVAEHGIRTTKKVFRGLNRIHDLIYEVQGGKVKGKVIIVVDQAQIDKEKNLKG
ncbi:uncharacterized protein E0L32_010169 [Thyridium curvatum]|uniref:Enoyl reductase (ER) domain-containing protein n=1 Tax=Thyridium curvatum TaxID=1093900 RepID=A0A507AGT8_9PEZI|nr:uncharacterized protein E0L32_010169 [Thyridium curvatum]TPX08102.1 hypothetical protein E0L32_010169 [Thyridium curvatum]